MSHDAPPPDTPDPGPAPGPPAPPPAAPSSPSLEIDPRGIGWVTFDDPERSQNVLTEAVMRRLEELLREVEELARAEQIRVLVLRSGKEDSFVAGADVDAIAAIEDPAEGERASRLGQAIFMQLETLPIPTVAAIHGTCLGGGTEMALACRYRLVSDADSTRIGLPEVQLGILPAWGGTTRLPRLVGLQAALDMLLTGTRISAGKADRIGFASRVLPREIFLEAVGDFADRTPEMPSGASRPSRGFLTRLLEDTAPGRFAVFRTARSKVLSRTGGHYPAPLAILDVLEKHLGGSVERCLEAEARAAGRLIASPVCRNLVHVFKLRQAARKEAGVAPGTEPRTVDAVGVLGAGVMGGGIAQLAAYHGRRVRMKDIREEAVTTGLQHARSLFDKAVSKKKLREREAHRAMERITGGVEYHGFQTLDLVVEAVVERMEVKRSVLAETEAVVSDACVLATNTSSLSVDAMAEALEQPERFGGLHFFNPVHKMPLVEVIRGRQTDDVTVATLHALVVELGKVPVVCADAPGFLVNRILGPYLNEAGWLLADGATVAEIDRAATEFGMPMGPLRLVDEVGIDITRHAGETLYEAFGERMAPAPPLVAIAETERLGRKNGRGFYRYEDGDEAGVDPGVYDDLGSTVPDPRGELVDSRTIRARLTLAMINEGARVLEDGVVPRAGDVDLGMIMGTGFPPFRGGLLRFADSLHLRAVVSRLQEVAATSGTRFEPAPLLTELAHADTTFYQAFGG